MLIKKRETNNKSMINYFHYRNKAERLKTVWQTFLVNEPAYRAGKNKTKGLVDLWLRKPLADVVKPQI